MKRTFLLLIVVLALTAWNVYAHDKGDLMLGIDHQIGFAIPSIGLMDSYGMFPGPGFFWGANAEYYFTDYFALGAGVGISGNYHVYISDSNIDPNVYAIPIVNIFVFLYQVTDLLIPDEGLFFASYVSIPFGLRFSARAFSLGAGGTANFPLYGAGSYEETVTFNLLPYIGWYADIGFDLSGRKERKGGFGMFFRVNGSFQKNTVESSELEFINNDDYLYGFNFFSMALVFRASFELANLHNRGKK
ncbi:MAG: hypothetical protein LBH16_03575 [Treponema sp.]|jgi:hypothetical protein|nr:hypothetical protein [Treponema sp.]